MGKSNVAVRYFSKSGNTKKLADEIAKAVGCKAEQIPAPVRGKVDILFLGASVYWGGISSEAINTLTALWYGRSELTENLGSRILPVLGGHHKRKPRPF